MDIITELQDFTGEDLTAEDQAVEGINEEFCLDTLLADSLKAVEQDQRIQASRKRLAKGGLEDAERLAIEATVRKWELERLWTPQASVMMFEVQVCNGCGTRHQHLAGYFQRQSHKTSQIERWQKIDASQATISPLPREVKENVTDVPVCYSCCSWGTDVTAQTVLDPN